MVNVMRDVVTKVNDSDRNLSAVRDALQKKMASDVTLPYLVELRKCARCRPTALAANRADARARIRFHRTPSPIGKNREDGRQRRAIAAKVSCRSTMTDRPP